MTTFMILASFAFSITGFLVDDPLSSAVALVIAAMLVCSGAIMTRVEQLDIYIGEE